MSIESDLKKDGIKIISKLDTLVVNNIARNISRKIVATFPELNFNETDLFIKLARIDMYTATMPDGMAEANYFYKNSSIYFNNKIDFTDLEEFAIHECIHHLQEIKTGKNKLLRMGLCSFNALSPIGMGINEAAVQLATAKMIGIEPDFVKYYGIELKSSSPSFLCILIMFLFCQNFHASITSESGIFKFLAIELLLNLGLELGSHACL